MTRKQLLELAESGADNIVDQIIITDLIQQLNVLVKENFSRGFMDGFILALLECAEIAKNEEGETSSVYEEIKKCIVRYNK